MEIISKELTSIESLDTDTQEMIRDYAMGEYNESVTDQINEFFLKLHDNGYWLKCDCNSKPPSIEHVYKLNNQFNFRWNRNSATHATSCAFYSSYRAKNPEGFSYSRIKTKVLNFHAAIPDDSDVEELSASRPTQRSPREGESIRRSSLGSLLLMLAENSNLNKLERWNQTPKAADIKMATHDFQVAKDIELSAVYRHNLSVFNLESISSQLINLSARWPSSSRPYGLVSGIIESFDKVQLKAQYREKHIPLFGRTMSLAPNTTEGPFLGICTYTTKEEETSTHNYHLMRTVLIPIVSETWPLPVESGLERKVALTLKDVMKALSGDKYRKTISLEKPLFAVTSNVSKKPIRPDFVLFEREGKKSLIVEVMGIKTLEYIERKKIQVPLMEENHPVYEIDMTGTPTQQEEALYKLYKHVLKFFGLISSN